MCKIHLDKNKCNNANQGSTVKSGNFLRLSVQRSAVWRDKIIQYSDVKLRASQDHNACVFCTMKGITP